MERRLTQDMESAGQCSQHSCQRGRLRNSRASAHRAHPECYGDHRSLHHGPPTLECSITMPFTSNAVAITRLRLAAATAPSTRTAKVSFLAVERRPDRRPAADFTSAFLIECRSDASSDPLLRAPEPLVQT